MTAFLPPNLLALFAPRDPVPHLPPAAKLGHEKKRLHYGCVALFLKDFEDPKDTPPPTRVETRDERTERKRREKAEQIAYKLEQDLAMWDPQNGTNTTKDAFKTLFIARVNYDTSESKLRREFESYGQIKKIRIVHDEQKTFKQRGYAFIEYDRERDMHNAYKNGDGKKIDGRRVLVDVERGRTVKGWRPRRLGGGLGGTRRGGPDENSKFSGRDDNPRREDDRREDDRGAERRRRSKSREKNRDREERPRRSRSRDRDRRRQSKEKKEDSKDEDDKKRKRSRRSRSQERPRRSRSRDRRRSRRSRDRGADKPAPPANPEEGEYNMDSEQAQPEFPEVHDYGHESAKPYGDGDNENTAYANEEPENGGYEGVFEDQYTEY